MTNAGIPISNEAKPSGGVPLFGPELDTRCCIWLIGTRDQRRPINAAIIGVVLICISLITVGVLAYLNYGALNVVAREPSSILIVCGALAALCVGGLLIYRSFTYKSHPTHQEPVGDGLPDAKQLPKIVAHSVKHVVTSVVGTVGKAVGLGGSPSVTPPPRVALNPVQLAKERFFQLNEDLPYYERIIRENYTTQSGLQLQETQYLVLRGREGQLIYSSGSNTKNERPAYFETIIIEHNLISVIKLYFQSIDAIEKHRSSLKDDEFTLLHDDGQYIIYDNAGKSTSDNAAKYFVPAAVLMARSEALPKDSYFPSLEDCNRYQEHLASNEYTGIYDEGSCKYIYCDCEGTVMANKVEPTRPVTDKRYVSASILKWRKQAAARQLQERQEAREEQKRRQAVFNALESGAVTADKPPPDDDDEFFPCV